MNLIVIDLETTGVDIHKDEVLQVSIIDGQKNVLLNEYCKPDTITDWPEAEVIHGITKEMVQDKPSFHAYVKNVQDYLSSADLILSFNGIEFDLPLLQKYGIHYDVKKCFDLYTEALSYYHRSFKLVDLVRFYGLKVDNAHNSLGDNYMLLDCYYKFKKEKNSSFWYYKSIDFILERLDQKVLDKATPLSKEGTAVDLSFYGRFAGVSTSIRGYRQHLLFNTLDRLVDSHCTCLDCLDGGNKMCKHVVAALQVLGPEATPYTTQHSLHLELLKDKKK